MTEISHHLWLASDMGKDMTEGEARELFLISRRDRFGVGERLFEEGQAPKELFLLADGEVDIVKKGVGKSVTTLATLGAGSVIGEMSLLMKENRSASAVVTKDAMVLCVTWKDFEELLLQNPLVATKLVLGIARVMAARLKGINAKLTDMVARSENHAPHEQIEEFATFKRKVMGDWSF